MTAKQVFLHPTFQMLVYAAIIGVAWGTLKSEIGQKASREEVNTTATALARAVAETDQRNSVAFTVITTQLQDVKNILCKRTPEDSYCSRNP